MRAVAMPLPGATGLLLWRRALPSFISHSGAAAAVELTSIDLIGRTRIRHCQPHNNGY
jgi:hypothetical protein